MEQLKKFLSKYFSNLGLDPSLGNIVLSGRPELCDYQCNGSFNAGKTLKQNPLVIADNLIKQLPNEIKELFEIKNEKGFINISLKEKAYFLDLKKNLSIVPENKKVVIDYGSPNIAKGMHIGHLRSTLIGACLCLIHKAKGHKTVGDNHIGDFGTPLGIVIHQIKLNPHIELSLENIESLYVKGSVLYKNDTDFKNEVLKTTQLLQQNDPQTKETWNQIVEITKKSLIDDYSQMGIVFDQWNGESAFEPVIPSVFQDLQKLGLIKESEGAKIVELKDMPSVILEKSGGGYLYHTTDIACVKTRQDYDQLLYVVDKRQALHFKQVFEISRLAGYLTTQKAEHIAFGTINGSDGKPFKTRSGEVLKLKEVIEEFKEATIKKLSAKLTEEEKQTIAPIIAIGSLKFAELKCSRTQDYVFNLEQFTSLEGVTAPYVMYAGVRAKSILNKHLDGIIKCQEKIHTEEEKKVWLLLNQFNDIFELSLKNNEPHHLCLYAYNLASAFNNFYNTTNILKESNEEVKSHYLYLVQTFYETLERVLGLLGIEIPPKM